MRATLGAATRPDDGDPLEWVRRAHEPAGRHRAARRRPQVITVPERLEHGRRRVSRSAVLSVLAVVLAVALVGGVRVAWAVRDSQPEVVTAEDREQAGVEDGSAREPGPASLEAEGATESEEPVLVVHVTGQVERPGIVRLDAGARVIDALESAGGPSDAADLTAVNLARPVVDGEQVYVPLPGELPPAVSSGGGGGSDSGSGGVVDLNTADEQTLDTLPGVGPVLAERIIAWRDEHGRFTSVEELAEVSGIGDAMLSRLRDKVSVGP